MLTLGWLSISTDLILYINVGECLFVPNECIQLLDFGANSLVLNHESITNL